MKYLTIFIVSLCALQYVSNVNASCDKNAIFGVKKPGDSLLFKRTIVTGAKTFQKTVYDIIYPSGDDIKGIISYIKVSDKYVDDNGGCASILSGGVNEKSVKIHLKSKRGNGMHFDVEIYGTRIW